MVAFLTKLSNLHLGKCLDGRPAMAKPVVPSDITASVQLCDFGSKSREQREKCNGNVV